MFCVYGKSRPLAKKKIQKLMADCFSDIFVELKKNERLNQSDKQLIVDRYVEFEFKSMKPKKCTHEFSAPEFSKEAYELMKKDHCNFSDLTLMKKVKKTKGITVSKKTNKIMLEWVKLNG
jgi:hypothetical protein